MLPNIKEGEKLYLVTRNDLKPGYQAVQSCHALRQFVEEHPDLDQAWFKNSNYIALLVVDDETQLRSLVQKAGQMGIRLSMFFEPDIDYQLTAIALEPSAKLLCKKLRTALQ